VSEYTCSEYNEHKYVNKHVSSEALQTLKPGKNVLAIHTVNSDRRAYIDAGLTDVRQPVRIVPALQKSVVMTATQTTYQFTAGKANIKLIFTSPLLMDQLEVLTRPASY